MSELMANYEMQRATRYGWKVGATFYARAPERTAPKRASVWAFLFGGN